uniref:Uncharacterized protein n=1 Tax=Glossina pallidipes TaxID=7398 RepID=A0A1A9ZI93_GLOPL
MTSTYTSGLPLNKATAYMKHTPEPKILNTIEIKLEERFVSAISANYRKQETGEFAYELAGRLRPLLLERILNLWVHFALSTVSVSCECGASYNKAVFLAEMNNIEDLRTVFGKIRRLELLKRAYSGKSRVKEGQRKVRRETKINIIINI